MQVVVLPRTRRDKLIEGEDGVYQVLKCIVWGAEGFAQNRASLSWMSEEVWTQ